MKVVTIMPNNKIPSEDDLYGIHQVLVERRDAEFDRQSVTDEAVKDAITWAEQERKDNFRYMNFGDADSATLAIDALRQMRSEPCVVRRQTQLFASVRIRWRYPQSLRKLRQTFERR